MSSSRPNNPAQRSLSMRCSLSSKRCAGPADRSRLQALRTGGSQTAGCCAGGSVASREPIADAVGSSTQVHVAAVETVARRQSWRQVGGGGGRRSECGELIVTCMTPPHIALCHAGSTE
jgi:hypothetical protein